MSIRILPIRTLLYYLTIVFVMATLSVASSSLFDALSVVRNFLSICLGAFFVYRVLLWRKFTRETRFEHRLITCLILSLLFYIDYPWYFYFCVGVLVELLQRVARLPSGPIFNPAALAATIVSLIHFSPVWWGASFTPRIPIIRGGMSIVVFLTVPVGLYVAWKYRKLFIVGTFLLLFILSHVLLVHRSPAFILLEGTLLFFVLVMVVEPKTSPVNQKEQIVYGAFLGILVPLAMRLHLTEPYLMPLLFLNLLFNTYRNRKTLLKPKPQTLVATQPTQ